MLEGSGRSTKSIIYPKIFLCLHSSHYLVPENFNKLKIWMNHVQWRKRGRTIGRTLSPSFLKWYKIQHLQLRNNTSEYFFSEIWFSKFRKHFYFLKNFSASLTHSQKLIVVTLLITLVFKDYKIFSNKILGSVNFLTLKLVTSCLLFVNFALPKRKIFHCTNGKIFHFISLPLLHDIPLWFEFREIASFW